MAKIVVTGGAGFLGSRVIARLVAGGLRQEDMLAPRSEEYDLTVRANCESVVAGAEIVVHAAGITGGGEFHRDHPGEIFYKNIVMGIELMEAARKAGVKKFVTIGSAAEYPEDAPLPLREETLWDGAPEGLHASYASAKRALLAQGQAYQQQYGFRAIHLLMTNMYGPGDKTDEGFVIPMMIERIRNAKAKGDAFIEVWGSGTPTRDFLYVDDAAEAVVLAAEKYDKPEPVNIGSGQEISIKELVATIAELMDFQGEIRWNTAKPDGQARRALDASRAEREFGFQATTSLREGLKKTFSG
jgi:GDP-L-fucose synthase